MALRPETSRSVLVSTTSPQATRALAGRLATVAKQGDLICLWGELGAGKTVMAKGFGAGLGVAGTITSPTFVLMAEYEGRLPLFHLDLYRIADAGTAVAGGLLDERQATGVTIVEWPDRLGPALAPDRLDVHIDGTDGATRRITISATDPELWRYLDAAGTGS